MKLSICLAVLCLSLLQSNAFVASRALQQGSSVNHLTHHQRLSPLPKPTDRNVQFVASMQASSASATINKAAVGAISKLIGTCGIGVWAAKSGILDQNSIGVLSKLIFSLFQPCLLFVNVASTVASSASGGSGGASLYMLPMMGGLQILLGYLIGKLVSLVVYRTNPNSEEAKQLLVCTTFANSGALPLVFADGLFRGHPNKALAANSIAYISMYLLGWSPLFWIVAPAILKDEAAPGDAAVSPSERRKATLKRIFSPPVLGAMSGLLVGAVPFLRKMFTTPDGPMNPVFESMRTIGTAYLPTVMMVLAGSLSSATNSAAAAKPGSTAAEALIERSKNNRAFALQVACVYIARFLLMPCAAFALVGLVAKYVPSVHKMFTQDPMLLLVLLLQTCMPSSQNTTVIYQLQKKSDAAGRLAKLLMVMYVLGIPAMSYWLIRILTLTGLGA